MIRSKDRSQNVSYGMKIVRSELFLLLKYENLNLFVASFPCNDSVI